MSATNFHIGIEEKNGQPTITVSPSNGFHVCERGSEFLQWLCESTVDSFQIDFKHFAGEVSGQPVSPIQGAAGPIKGSQAHPMTPVLIDDGLVPFTLRSYYYSVSVVPANGAHQPPPLDPHIVVNGGRAGIHRHKKEITALTDAALKAAADSIKENFISTDGSPNLFFQQGIQSLAFEIKLEPLEVRFKIN